METQILAWLQLDGRKVFCPRLRLQPHRRGIVHRRQGHQEVDFLQRVIEIAVLVKVAGRDIALKMDPPTGDRLVEIERRRDTVKDNFAHEAPIEIEEWFADRVELLMKR